LGGRADRRARCRRLAARLDDARRRRGARAPLPDARRAGEQGRGDLRGDRVALAQRAPVGGARHGRRACARAGEGRLAAAAATRGRGRVLDPRRPRRANAAMSSIISQIKDSGEEAVRRWAEELDGVEPARAHPSEWSFPREELLALADRVRRWHQAQRPADITLEVEPGVTLERRWVPIESVGIYVPRNLVSTLVMCAVPAQTAGVEKIVVCTPPQGASLIAAAAELLGLEEGGGLGGPQAIGWLAYVRKVVKIVGPGNAHVNAAKLEVSRDVAIDLPGGPSEVVVVADDAADRRLVELELAAQGEHGADAVCKVVSTLEEAEAIAPEHLVLLGESESRAPEVRNARAVVAGTGRRLRDRRQPRLADRRLGTLDRRPRARDVPEAGHDAAPDARGARPHSTDGRGARSGRGDAGAQRGGAARMRALAPE